MVLTEVLQGRRANGLDGRATPVIDARRRDADIRLGLVAAFATWALIAALVWWAVA